MIARAAVHLLRVVEWVSLVLFAAACLGAVFALVDHLLEQVSAHLHGTPQAPGLRSDRRSVDRTVRIVIPIEAGRRRAR